MRSLFLYSFCILVAKVLLTTEGEFLFAGTRMASFNFRRKALLHSKFVMGHFGRPRKRKPTFNAQDKIVVR